MKMKERLKFLKLLNEFRSLDYELQYVKEVLGVAHQEFEEYYREWCAENDVDLAELNKANSKKVAVTFQKVDTTELRQKVNQKLEAESRDFKSVYRKLAKKLHPDMLSNDDPRKLEYSNAFRKASMANKEGRWGELFDIVDKYDIPLGEYEEAIDSIRHDIKRVKAVLDKEKSTFSWKLYESETEAQKVQVVKGFLRQLFGWKG
jgi:hypothetical protein